MQSPFPPDSAVQDLMRQLLAREAEERRDVAALADAAERVIDKLHLHLSKLLGADGYRVLLARAVVLARSEFPWLGSVHVQSDGFLKGLVAAVTTEGIMQGDKPPDAVFEGTIAVLVQFLGLLEAFIGQNLTLRLLQGIWPDVDPLRHFAPKIASDTDPGIDPLGEPREETGGTETTR